ncbi:hypothetical protein TI05_07575 [Achromatium sp. WMS3]|nr:hypothetical protein TI05_07575 [Achromatium sp. WMS3]
MNIIVFGDSAPNFELSDQNGNIVSLAALQGKKVLLYFYPKADTPGCTTQSCEVSQVKNIFLAQNTIVLGISPDTPEIQKQFDTKYNLGFPLLSDPDHKVAIDYGVWQEKSMYGKKYMGIVRSSFLIDEAGIVIDSWYKITPKNTVPKALKSL